MLQPRINGFANDFVDGNTKCLSSHGHRKMSLVSEPDIENSRTRGAQKRTRATPCGSSPNPLRFRADYRPQNEAHEQQAEPDVTRC